jgi:hypothetical protein
MTPPVLVAWCLLVLATLTTLIWAVKRWWRTSPRIGTPAWKGYLAVGAIALVGLSELLWILFGILVNVGRGDSYDTLLTWTAGLGLYAAPAALLASLFGKGILRWPACTLSIVMGGLWVALFWLFSGTGVVSVQAQSKQTWKSVEFAIVKLNDEAPKSWSMYHTEKKGLLLLRIWKRYLLVNVKEEEVYEIDPQTVKPVGDNVEWSPADKPSEPLETPEWKTRDIGPMEQVSFRVGKNGSVLQLQIPLKMNGQPAY